MANLIFKEEQTYQGTWLMYLILILELPTLIVVSIVVWTSEEDQLTATLVTTAFILVMLLTFGLIMSLKLSTRIDEEGIKFKYFPFINQWRVYPQKEIKSAQVVAYSPVSDFGGWGIKGNRTTKAYSILGDQALLVDLGEKKKIMIGTQKSKELKSFLEDWLEEEN